MLQSPLATSEIFTVVTPRMFSPSIETMASVNLWMISRFCSGLNTFSIRWTYINGIVVLPLLERRQSNRRPYHHRIAFVEKGDKGEIYGVMVF